LVIFIEIPMGGELVQSFFHIVGHVGRLSLLSLLTVSFPEIHQQQHYVKEGLPTKMIRRKRKPIIRPTGEEDYFCSIIASSFRRH
jgi:hypothetical protein